MVENNKVSVVSGICLRGLKMEEYTYYENKLYDDNKSLLVTHNRDGSVTISIVWRDILRHSLYQGYTVKQAKTLFCEAVNLKS